VAKGPYKVSEKVKDNKTMPTVTAKYVTGNMNNVRNSVLTSRGKKNCIFIKIQWLMPFTPRIIQHPQVCCVGKMQSY
jgi:hypothetical protein